MQTNAQLAALEIFTESSVRHLSLRGHLERRCVDHALLVLERLCNGIPACKHNDDLATPIRGSVGLDCATLGIDAGSRPDTRDPQKGTHPFVMKV